MAIDSDPRFQEAYPYFFSTYREFDLVGMYPSLDDALQDFDQVKPDIILSEVNLPFRSGIEAIAEFRKRNSQAQIIMVSEENTFEVIKQAFKFGASGYLTKPIDQARLYSALNSVRYEGAAISSDIARQVISMFRRKHYDCFSQRENEIIEYLSQGATYKTIAEKLYVTPSTINFHIQNIYLKLDVNSKSEALQKLRQMDLAS